MRFQFVQRVIVPHTRDVRKSCGAKYLTNAQGPGSKLITHSTTRCGQPRNKPIVTGHFNRCVTPKQNQLSPPTCRRCSVISSDKDTERVWQRRPVRKLDQATQRMALRKLLFLDAADALGDLRVPPVNRLEKLNGDRAGAYSVRINQQWRICFAWTTAGPEDVEIVDYHC